MDKFELYYQVAFSHLLEQDQRNRDLEIKASGTLGVGVAIVGLAALVIADFSTSSSLRLSAYTFLSLAALGIMFVGVFVCTIYTLWVRSGWDRRPDPEELAENLSKFNDNELAEWVGDGISKAYKINEKNLVGKANAIRLGMTALSAETVFLALLAITTRL